MQAFDINGNNVFDTQNQGFKAKDRNSFNLVFKLDFESSFYKGSDTQCMYNQFGSTSKWSNEGCQTIRVEGLDDTPSIIKCTCDTLYDYDYAIISAARGPDSLVSS